MNNVPNEQSENQNRTICLPFEEKEYSKLIKNAKKFREYLDRMIEAFPELFPHGIHAGYRMKDQYLSKKQSLSIRRIEIGNTSYSIRPSFVMPYMSGLTEEVQKILFLRKFAVPFWGLAYVFGRNAMYWYRMEQSLGRNSIVGTTVNDPKNMPKNLSADEKHSWLLGERVYIATTVGQECILGVAIAESAGEKHLQKAYGQFKEEAQLLRPGYTPDSVNLDGWEPTHKAWKSLFPATTIILCFLHIFISIRDRAKKKYKEIFPLVAEKLWHCYRAEGRQFFSQRVCRLYQWALKNSVPPIILDKLAKLRYNLPSYAVAYHFPKSHRTSNMLDRLVQRLDRFLFSIQYFHGNDDSALLSLRAWALIYNFAPWNPYTSKKHGAKTKFLWTFKGVFFPN